MTLEAVTPSVRYTVSGIGPYALHWPYFADTILVEIENAGGLVALAATDFTLTPLKSITEGNVFLTPSAAALWAGKKIVLTRNTPAEQAWQATQGEREYGMEVQLDRTVMRLQEIETTLGGVPRIAGQNSPPIVLNPGESIIWDGTKFTAGPTAAQIATAQGFAEQAIAAAVNAMVGSPYGFTSLSAIQADVVLSYSPGANKQVVVPGQYILAGGYRYLVAAASASDQNLITLGGVKLYATPSNGIVIPAQFGTGQAALEAAITYARINNVICDGLGATYTLTTALTAIPGQVCNMTIDASALATATAWQPVGGAYEAAKTLTADTRQGKRLWTATAHGYAVGDIVLIQSTLVIETLTNSQAAHWGRISAVTTNTFTTHEAALCNFLTANAASVRRLPKSAAVVMDNVKIIGGATCVNGFWPIRFTDVTTDMIFESCKSRSLTIQECYAPYVRCNRASNSDATGLGYGVALSGNGWARVDLAMGRRCRHALTTGALGVIPTVGGTVGDVIAHESLAAGFDMHPATMGFSQTGKAVVYLADDLAGEDGMVCQAIGGSINCEIKGVGNRNAVTIQPFHVAAAFDTPPSFTVVGRSSVLNAKGVFFDFKNCGPVKSVDVDYFGSSTEEAIWFDIGPIAVDSLRISGAGVSTTGRAMRVICDANADLGYVEQTGNWQGAANEVSYILGQTAVVSRTTQWSFLGQSAGGTHGARATNKVWLKARGAAFLAGSIAKIFTSGGATVEATIGRFSATIDFPSIAAGAYADLTISAPGAAFGDFVTLSRVGSAFAGIGVVFMPFVSAANTVTVRAFNITGAAIDPASFTGAVLVERSS